ncbi:MAG: TetR family transcriptional regulator [Hahellaceae bacterium]|nr:TetR family transcriptional regulator [Hahellaceae bacterium]MCP5211849.1 TetR family transcriptional regulator [Hahellaceae bacterium]
MIQASAKEVAQAAVGDSLKNSIHYQGRKAARAKSEHRRRLILEATLRLVAKEGIRGVKHRSVAKEAGVPLASTTYYFKDIDELISDAFMLFAENSQKNLESFYGQLASLISAHDYDELTKSKELRDKLCDQVVSLGVQYINAQIRFRKNDILAEQAFLLESIRDEMLKPIARKYRIVWQSSLANLLRDLGSKSPDENATIIISTVYSLQYDGVINDGILNDGTVRRVWKRLLDGILDQIAKD